MRREVVCASMRCAVLAAMRKARAQAIPVSAERAWLVDSVGFIRRMVRGM